MDIAQVCRICANKIKNANTERNIFKYMRGKLLIQLKLITGVEVTVVSLYYYNNIILNSDILIVNFRPRTARGCV